MLKIVLVTFQMAVMILSPFFNLAFSLLKNENIKWLISFGFLKK